MNFQEMFLKIKKKTDKSELKDFNSFLAIQINVTDLDCGGAFYVEHKEGKFSVEPYDYKDKTAELTCDYKTLLRLIDGKTELEKAIGSGNAAVDGSWEHIKKVVEAFAENNLKKAVKKVKAKAEPLVKETIKKAKPKVEKAVKTAEPVVKETIKKVKPKIEKAVKTVEPKVKKTIDKVKDEVSETVKKIKKK